MKNSKNTRTTVLAGLLVGLLIIAYKFMFVDSVDPMTAEENVATSQRVESILREVESINFDTNLVNDAKFQSLKSIETPLPSLPVGKKNPFSISGSN